MADRFIITKTDLAEPDGLQQRLAAINPHAEVRVARHGAVEAGAWEPALPPRAEPVRHGVGAAHSDGVATFALTFERPVSWRAFTLAMEVLTGLRGPDLLRVKGLMGVEGHAGPLVVQVVHHVMHSRTELPRWPDADRRGRLVFIGRKLARRPVEALFQAVLGLQAGEGQSVTGD